MAAVTVKGAREQARRALEGTSGRRGASVVDELDAGLPPAVSSGGGGRGGRRETTAQARWTDQMTWLDTAEVKARVLKLAKDHGVSQATIMRAACQLGLETVESGLAAGTFDLAPYI